MLFVVTRRLKTLLLNRDEIDEKYSVLPFLPLPRATEQITWVTNIFVSADLSERRNSLARYPAIRITYEFVITPDTRDWLDELITSAKNEWVLPYFPHMTFGRRLPSGQIIITSVGGHDYPYHKYCCVYSSARMIYKEITTTAGNSSDVRLSSPIGSGLFNSEQQLFVAPCFVAILHPVFSYNDVGPYRYGGSVKLTFRMTAESEQAMTYDVDDFDFINSAQQPLSVSMNRRQLSFAPKPAPAHTYTPNVYRKNQTPKTRTTFWLNYDNFVRQDYQFRGAIMKRLGSQTADHYLNNQILHRISDDMVTIAYDLGRAKATTMLREVVA